MKKNYFRKTLLALVLLTIFNAGISFVSFWKKKNNDRPADKSTDNNERTGDLKRDASVSSGPNECIDQGIKSEKDDEYLYIGCNRYF